MANYQAVKVVTLPAGEDLTGDYAEIVKINATGQVVKVTAVTDVTAGVLAESAPSSDTGQGVPVALIGGGGVLKFKAGAAIIAGNLLVPHTTDGRVAGIANIGALVVDQMAFGVALSAAAAGEIFSGLAMPIGAPHVA